MKLITKRFFIFGFFLFLVACQQTSPLLLEEQALSWIQLGPALDTPSDNRIENLELIQDASGDPVVAWQEDFQENGRIYVKRWKDSQNQWESLGVVATPGDSGSLELALGKNKLGIAFSQSVITGTDVTNRIHVKQLKGNSWEQLGSAIPHDLGSTFSLVMDNHEMPLVSFRHNNDIYVKRWAFNKITHQFQWQPMRGKLNTPTGNLSNAVFAQNPKIILAGPHQRPYVAWFEINWSENPIKTGVRIKRWENGAWVPFDFIETSASPFFYFQKDNNGFPVLTSEANSGLVSIWSWENSGRSLRANLEPTSGFPHVAALAFDASNRPVVLQTKGFRPSHIRVKSWNGSSWVNVGPIVDQSPIGYDQRALIVDKQGRLVVARTEIETGIPSGFQNNIYVQRYE